MWKWLQQFGRYFSEKLGRFFGRGDTLAKVDDLQKAPKNVADQLASWVASGQIDAKAFEAQMRQQIKQAYISEYLLGRGGINAMKPLDWGSIGGMLKEQYKYLAAFAQEIAEGKLTEAQIRARAQMYINSSREAFERAKARVAALLNLTEEKWILNPQAENCPDCIYYSQQGWKPVAEEFYPVPGDGSTQCLCIVSPQSLVYTRRGAVPMYEVAVGDFVLTHNRTWKRVTGVVVKPATGTERLAFIRAPGGQWVACTDTHLWYTDCGWRNAKGFDNRLLMCYPVPQEDNANEYNGLSEMRSEVARAVKESDVYAMPVSVRVWEPEGLQGGRVQGVRIQSLREDSMGDETGNDAARDTGCGCASQNPLPGFVDGYRVATQAGRTLLDLALGRGCETNGLPLPMGVDHSKRADPSGPRHSPFEQGSERRQDREPCACCEGQARTDSFTRAQPGSLGRTHKADMDVRDMRENVQALIPQEGGWVSSCEVLLAGLLPRGTALYDLQVAQDHSFVIEGLAAHNTNCKCHKVYKNPKNGYVL